MNQLVLILSIILLAVGGVSAIVLTGNIPTAIEIFKEHGPKILFLGQLFGMFWAGCTGNVKLMVILLITICGTVWWGW